MIHSFTIFLFLFVYLFSGIRIAGHSAGAHLTVWLMNYLIRNSHKHSHLIRTLYLVAGIYDLTELRFNNAENEQNILDLNDENTVHLSPMFFSFDQWRNANVDIKIYLAEFDAPKFGEQNKCLYEILRRSQLNVESNVLRDVDHFNLVEKLAEENYELTKLIINDSKLRN